MLSIFEGSVSSGEQGSVCLVFTALYTFSFICLQKQSVCDRSKNVAQQRPRTPRRRWFVTNEQPTE